MKRAFILLAMASALPHSALAQIPTVPPASSSATAPTPPPATGPAPSDKAPPGDQYYVEAAPPAPPAPAADSPAPADRPAPSAEPPPPFEPPPPPGVIFEEPPPPPLVHHRAPNSALWLGARLGWFFPFGNLYAKAQPVSSQGASGYVLEGVPWRDYASSGPVLELDAGLRLGRAYTLFALWERAQLGSGNANTGPDGKQDGAESDFWALGLRASSNPDDLAFITEVAVGYRRSRTFFSNETEYQFTDAPFEARLGLGAENRVNRMISFSGLATVGVGGFGQIERVAPNGTATSLTRSYDEADGHAWVTLTLGAHFDLVPSKY